ncbi:MAG: rhodanese-like domain-containing protein [Bauldia sp.]|nr:rhodanese-like domain-containing protein [Bauldia sp.]
MAQSGSYAGEVSVEETWDALKASPEATLIDVRTQAEWTYVGVPALDTIGKEPILIEWQAFPTGARDPAFVQRLAAHLEALGLSNDAPLFFICRSGSRSRSAATAMAAAGFTQCFNVAPGFEGPLDQDGHRNAVSGWRASGLPWTQS